MGSTMAREPAAKRRKLSPSEDEEEAGSSDAEDEDEEMEESDGSEDGEEDGESDGKASVEQKTVMAKVHPERKINGITNGTAAAFTGEVYKSNVFMLQVDDLLQSVRPKYT